ncbi:SET and MYND domain-containing protein 4 isoform X1 [Gallus gallus]|uniref:SET and MYND domain-containing protein 4 isoform X1 n=1 Tax=Gallus gallus TaxID=9031 RepID=UPI001AE43F44|nr:SET and MYND domain-containing protein 4 isoform X1 [Gallus gallus]
MALPVEEWRRSAARCWAVLEPALRERLAAAPLGEALRMGCGLFGPEEAALQRLCRRARTGKEPAAARFYREEGNRQFGRCCYRDAVRLYSQAAAHEPPRSPEVALCFANRSAALFHLGHFEVCLEDIARAESHGYPDRLLPKVLLRKAECLLRLGKLQDATDTLTAVENKMTVDGIMTSPIHRMLLKKLSQLKTEIHEGSCPEPAREAHGDIQRESEIWEENGSISESGDGAVVNKKPVRLATAFFPVLSLLNHSCSPNISVSFSGTAATVRASQPIPSGQEIFHCYGPHRCRMRVAERQQLLSQYFFECRCQACLDELESDVESVSMRNSFCCPSCQASMQGEEMLCCSNEACAFSVSRERLSQRLLDLQQQMEKALELLRDSKADEAIKMLLKCQIDARNFLSPEHLLMGELEDHLAQVYATLGKWQEAARHLGRSIQLVEMHHGPSSVEMGHELFKLAQILFNGFAVSEALSTIQRAEEILSVHCGPQSTQIQELQEMKTCLLELPRSILQRT